MVYFYHFYLLNILINHFYKWLFYQRLVVLLNQIPDPSFHHLSIDQQFSLICCFSFSTCPYTDLCKCIFNTIHIILFYLSLNFFHSYTKFRLNSNKQYLGKFIILISSSSEFSLSHFVYKFYFLHSSNFSEIKFTCDYLFNKPFLN